MDPRHPKPITPMPRLVLRQQRIEPLLKRPNPGQWLHRAMIIESTFGRRPRLRKV